ncbi:MAG: hypothetical protein Q8881_02075 [Sweet potato little leaf phytoplasma]|nr:hypothetical protein [Sweet potato little leaf phytoplasma]
MSDTDNAPETASEQQLQEQTKKLSNLTFSIWPPSQRTRDAVSTRLIETLSTPSVLSKRYGTIPEDEAVTEARRIEEEAYNVANGAFSSEKDGLEILQMYSKEISKRMLDAVKGRANGSDDVAENEEKSN